jgi:micrococcal nuclease
MSTLKDLAILALFGILLAGCAGPDPRSAPGVRLRAEITYVVDGDTVVAVATERQRFRVRLLGIDAPEDTRQHECFGRQATAELRRLLPAGSQVSLYLQRHPDSYGRALAFVWRPDGLFINEAMLRRGYATTLFLPPTDHRRAQFVAAERQARHHRSGLWRTCHSRSPPQFPS